MKYVKGLYKIASSMKMGLALLVVIGILSGIGSFLVLENFYQAGYFQIFLLLLLINMTLCSINQISRSLKSGFQNFTLTLRKIALLILHIGVVLILLGGTLQSFYGERAQLAVIQGEVGEITWKNQSATPLSLRLDQYNIIFNPDGSPSQFESYVTVLQGQQKVEEEVIRINYPLVYEGTKVYLFNYGYKVGVEGKSLSGWDYKNILWEKEPLEIPETGKTLKIIKYVPNYDSRYGERSKTARPDNPRVLYTILEEGQPGKTKVASLQEGIEITPDVTIKFTKLTPYAMFIAKHDPGLPLAGVGGVMLMAGTCMVLFTPARNKSNSIDSTGGTS